MNRAQSPPLTRAEFRGLLEQTAGFRRRALPQGAKFASPEEIVLEYGREWEWHPRPDGFGPGFLRQCFVNAGTAVLMDNDGGRYVYCEGIADGTVMPVHHAWVLDQVTGRIIDVTWRDSEQDDDCGFCIDGYVTDEDADGDEYAEEKPCVFCDATGKRDDHRSLKGVRYMGVPFDPEWLRGWLLEKRVWGVFDKAEPFKRGLRRLDTGLYVVDGDE